MTFEDDDISEEEYFYCDGCSKKFFYKEELYFVEEQGGNFCEECYEDYWEDQHEYDLLMEEEYFNELYHGDKDL